MQDQWKNLRNIARDMYHKALKLYLEEYDAINSPSSTEEMINEANRKMTQAREDYIKAINEANTFRSDNEVPDSEELKPISYFFF
jgi:hypothetical protein